MFQNLYMITKARRKYGHKFYMYVNVALLVSYAFKTNQFSFFLFLGPLDLLCVLLLGLYSLEEGQDS